MREQSWEFHDRWRRAAEQLTVDEAAELVRRSPATIRQWVVRGHLRSVGMRGRAKLYDRSELRLALEHTSRFATTPATEGEWPSPPRLRLRSQDLAAIVTGREAAVIAGVSSSTIRSWVSRGHLRPTAARPGVQSMYRVSEVLAAIRRRKP